MPATVLAIDQGTTGTSVLAVDEDGGVLAHAYREHRQCFPAPGLVEHDGEEIWSNVVALVAEALVASGRPARSVAALGITNQRETTLLWDRRSGELLAPAVVWQDRRGAALCEQLAAAGAGPLVASRTGLVLDPYFSATKLAVLLRDSPELRRRAEGGEVAFGTVDSFLLWRLSGGERHVTDVTNASRTLLMDLASSSWDAEMCELFGVPAAILPEIVPSIGSIAEVVPDALPALELAGRSRPLTVSGVLGDQQAALFAQGCHARGQAKNTYGTGSFVLANTGAEAPLGAKGLLATVAAGRAGLPAHGAGGAVTYALEGAILATGSAVQWLRDGLGVISSAAETEALASSLRSNDDVYFVPALAGIGAPFWDPFARGTLLGATRGTTRAHLARAVLESIAYRTCDVLQAMAAAGRPVAELRVDGGATMNSWLMQFQADMAGIPIDVAEVTETTSLGAAHAAGLGAGLWESEEDLAELRRSRAVFEPRLSSDERGAAYARWREALERSLSWARA